MDDTSVIQKEENKQNFLQQINSVDPAIQFTVENNKKDGGIPFLDTTVKPENGGKLSITVYRKPTLTQTNTYSGSATIISQLNIVLSVPSLKGPKQCVKVKSSSKKKWSISERLSPIVNTPNGLWTRWRKDLPGQLMMSMMELTARVPQVPSPLPVKINQGSHSYTIHPGSL